MTQELVLVVTSIMQTTWNLFTNIIGFVLIDNRKVFVISNTETMFSS